MKPISFLLSLCIASGVIAAEPKKELVGAPKVVVPVDYSKTRPIGLKAAESAAKLGWKIGSQSYTLRDRTLLEALDALDGLGIRYVECYLGQAVSKEIKDAKGKPVTFGPGMTPEATEAVKKKLESTGIKILSCGVTGIPADEAGARKFIEWAKSWGMETIVTESKKEQFPLLDKLTEELKINVALHNHPQPSIYWNPAFELECLAGTSNRIGSCSDVGHWQRSDVNPIEGLKTLEGRIIESHFKDLNVFGKGKGGHDVPWGTGAGNARGMLEEILRQTKAGKIAGLPGHQMTFNIEYEIGQGTELVSNMAKCVEWFGQTCEELSAAK